MRKEGRRRRENGGGGRREKDSEVRGMKNKDKTEKRGDEIAKREKG